MASKTYITTVGINYPTAKGEVRVEAGEKVSDLPAKSIPWLRENGLIIDPKDAAAQAEETTPDAAEAEEAPSGDD